MINLGGLSFSNVNSANVPVDIWLTEIEENESNLKLRPYIGWWRLSADNYCPRRGHVYGDAYEVLSQDREELSAIVRDTILPLYKNAVSHLEAMVAGTHRSLYYWDELK